MKHQYLTTKYVEIKRVIITIHNIKKGKNSLRGKHLPPKGYAMLSRLSSP